MVINTSTIGQLPEISNLLDDDIFEIARNNGSSAHATAEQIATFVGSIPIQSLEFTKVLIPDDPPIEEGIMYLKKININDNGLFIKIKKEQEILEVLIV